MHFLVCKSNDKGVAAMLDELTIEANEESFIVVLQHGGNDITWKQYIDGLQSIPRESNDKDVVAMLDELTIEANEESFVIILQHGINDITWKRSIAVMLKVPGIQVQSTFPRNVTH